MSDQKGPPGYVPLTIHELTGGSPGGGRNGYKGNGEGGGRQGGRSNGGGGGKQHRQRHGGGGGGGGNGGNGGNGGYHANSQGNPSRKRRSRPQQSGPRRAGEDRPEIGNEAEEGGEDDLEDFGDE